MIARRAACLLVVAAASVCLAEGQDGERTSVASVNGVVVHDVDQKVLRARLREVDQRLVERDTAFVAKTLAELTGSDLPGLIEEGEGVYLSAEESVLQRVALLWPEALAEYRARLDGRARSALIEAARRGDVPALARDAQRFAFTESGPALLLLLSDLRVAAGDLGGAARALEDLLRLLHRTAPTPALAGAASRLAGIVASAGDGAAVRGLAADLGPDLLAAPSPLGGGRTLGEELAAAAELADLHGRSRTAGGGDGPRGALRLVGEIQFGVRETSMDWKGREPGTLREHPIPVGTPSGPVLLCRMRRDSRVVAVAPDPAPPPDRIGALRPLWAWPSSPAEDRRPALLHPFAPARLGRDLVVFTWPGTPSESSRRDVFSDAADERHELVVLSVSGEGRLVEVRGAYETEREDGDPELESLSLCGRPFVDGTSVYATAVRHAERGDQTELHVCRFDLVPSGRDGRLQLRWRRHVLDGRAMPPAMFPITDATEVLAPPALPSWPLVRAGRVYVASNTGAVACLDAASGRPEWIETYDRFGPSSRVTVRETELTAWDDVPLFADGAFVYAAPRDSESLLQYRRAPRGALSLRIEDFSFAAPNGTARRPSRLIQELIPTEVAGVRDGVAYLSGRVARRSLGPMRGETTPSDGTPLAAFPLAERRGRLAQIQEFAPAGTPSLLSDAILFPSPKAIYRIPLADFEGTPATLWTNRPESGQGRPPGRAAGLPDRIGTLVPDGDRLWSVTPTRIVLFEPEP